jgi:repressor LexA
MVLTKRQHDTLRFLQDFLEDKGYCPSYEEIAAGLNLTSLATVHAHLTALEKKGYLRRGYNQSRSIELRRAHAKRPPSSHTLPLAGRIAAGKPVEAVEGTEEISLADITRNRASFVLEVRGDSMVDDHILNGDYVLVERREQADDGQIVVALVDGVEATLKRIYHEKGGIIRLQPANAAMPPIRVPAASVRIQGRVIGVLRKY